MKYLLIALLSFSLAGCGLDYQDRQKRIDYCERMGGEAFDSLNSQRDILGVYCNLNGVRYRVGSSADTLRDGVKLKDN